ncbi:hypothetical protein [Bacillus cereus]|nr:hypothetical protein [Bacillus cereus]
MKNKKKQLIKGIMLSTVLGLGWSAAGDISHAAGNELSQIQETAEWKAKREYVKGAKVSYKGTEYQLMWGNLKPQVTEDERTRKIMKVVSLGPDNHIQWHPIGGETPEWSAKRGYLEGAKVSYNRAVYQATKLILGGINPAEDSTGWKEIEGAISKAKHTPHLKIIIHEGTIYGVMYSNNSDIPDSYCKLVIKRVGTAEWIPVNKELSDILAEKEGAISKAKDKPDSKNFLHEGTIYRVMHSNNSDIPDSYCKLVIKRDGTAKWIPVNKELSDILAKKEGTTSQEKNTPVVPR